MESVSTMFGARMDDSQRNHKSMEEYVEDCVNRQLLSVDASLIVLSFWEAFHARYPSLTMDAAPSFVQNEFMLAIDDSQNHMEFELIGEVWECFYRDRKTEESFFEEFNFCHEIPWEEFDPYIKRFSR
jgi:hypothetical protein